MPIYWPLGRQLLIAIPYVIETHSSSSRNLDWNVFYHYVEYRSCYSLFSLPARTHMHFSTRHISQVQKMQTTIAVGSSSVISIYHCINIAVAVGYLICRYPTYEILKMHGNYFHSFRFPLEHALASKHSAVSANLKLILISIRQHYSWHDCMLHCYNCANQIFQTDLIGTWARLNYVKMRKEKWKLHHSNECRRKITFYFHSCWFALSKKARQAYT